jgi:brefeldin A-resistance guanine nucleotide exchange factor 1
MSFSGYIQLLMSRLVISLAWMAFWLPLLLTIAKHSVNGSRDIRQRAIGYLQRVLLSSQVLPDVEQDVALVSIFSRVLFPVVDELLKPQVYNQDPPSMEETRLRASALTCKAFLQYLIPLSEKPERLLEVFLRIVDVMERFMRTGSRQLVSAFPRAFPRERHPLD